MTQNLSFHPERPCLNPEEHVGRESLLQHAFGRLGTDDVQSFAIYGFSKEGKTSFVKYLQQDRVVERYLGDKAKQYIFLYFDVAELQLHDEDAFFKVLYSKISEVLAIPNLKDFSDNKKILDCLEKSNRKLIMIFDNFNLIVVNPKYRVSFFESFRSWLYMHSPVGCIMTSPMRLLDLAMSVELAGSPFFNIFDYYSLFPLSQAEATRLVSERLPEALQDSQKDIFELIGQFGYSPYPLQEAGKVWVSHSDKTGQSAFNKQVINEAYQACLPYYEEIYASLTKQQLESIASILSGNKSNDVVVDNYLVDRGWVTKNKTRISAGQMERFFRERLEVPDKYNFFSTIKYFFGDVFKKN